MIFYNVEAFLPSDTMKMVGRIPPPHSGSTLIPKLDRNGGKERGIQAASTHFGLRREAQRHAAFVRRKSFVSETRLIPLESGVAAVALPSQSKTSRIRPTSHQINGHVFVGGEASE